MTDSNDLLATHVREAIRQLRDLPGDLEAEDDPAFTTEQVNFLEKRLYEVCALLEANQPDDDPEDFNLRIHERLASQHEVAAIWSIEDVQEVRPDLSADHAWEVLQLVRK